MRHLAETPWDQRQFNYDALDAAVDTSTLHQDAFGEGKDLADSDWQLYNVMLIDNPSGIASRQGIGVIQLKAFHQAKPKRTLIILG